eukprot:Platyproteum_vivax@DN6691_c0_g1_i1.p1
MLRVLLRRSAVGSRCFSSAAATRRRAPPKKIRPLKVVVAPKTITAAERFAISLAKEAEKADVRAAEFAFTQKELSDAMSRVQVVDNLLDEKEPVVVKRTPKIKHTIKYQMTLPKRIQLTFFYSIHHLVNKLWKLMIQMKGSIHPNGYFLDDEHWPEDEILYDSILDFLEKEKCRSLIEFGCGRGALLKMAKLRNLVPVGVDGYPRTNAVTLGLGHTFDLTLPLPDRDDPRQGFGFPMSDWLVCLNTAEYIPKYGQRMFLRNIDEFNHQGVIINWMPKWWAVLGAVTRKNPMTVIRMFEERGYEYDAEASEKLRQACTREEAYGDTLLVLRNK